MKKEKIKWSTGAKQSRRKMGETNLDSQINKEEEDVKMMNWIFAFYLYLFNHGSSQPKQNSA